MLAEKKRGSNMDDHCPDAPTGRHCWHKDPKPDYSRAKPYRRYCCWCGQEVFEGPLDQAPDHGPCTDATCREKSIS
ncbi:hypothetical protein [Desulfovibrio sp.]